MGSRQGWKPMMAPEEGALPDPAIPEALLTRGSSGVRVLRADSCCWVAHGWTQGLREREREMERRKIRIDFYGRGTWTPPQWGKVPSFSLFYLGFVRWEWAKGNFETPLVLSVWVPTPEHGAHQVIVLIDPVMGPVSETQAATPRRSPAFSRGQSRRCTQSPLHYENFLIFHRASLSFQLLSPACLCLPAVKRCVRKPPFSQRVRTGEVALSGRSCHRMQGCFQHDWAPALQPKSASHADAFPAVTNQLRGRCQVWILGQREWAREHCRALYNIPLMLSVRRTVFFPPPLSPEDGFSLPQAASVFYASPVHRIFCTISVNPQITP